MSRRAFTMVELLLVLLIIAVLVAVAIPAVARYRESNRSNVCQNNLRELGIGFHVFSERDAKRRFCTNAYDLQRDGCPDTNSWVGNILELKSASSSTLICPANPVRGLDALNQLIGNPAGGNVVTMTLEGVTIADITGGFCKNFEIAVDPTQVDRSTPDNPYVNPGLQINGCPQRLQATQQAVQAGFNTNYSQSWFIARQHLRTITNSMDSKKYQTRGNCTDQSGAYAGCSVRFVEKSSVASCAVPMLGDAAPGDISQAILSDTLGSGLQKGDRLGVSFGRGPSFINSQTVTAFAPTPIEIISAWTTENVSIATWGVAPAKLTPATIPIGHRGANGKSLTAFVDDTLPLPDEETFGGVDLEPNGATDQNIHGLPNGYGGQDGILVLQDTRNFRAVHHPLTGKQCNLLFADASVRTLLDLNGDGYINPGFPVTPNAKPSKAERESLRASARYENNQCEAAPADFYNGPVLDDVIYRKTCTLYDYN